MNRLISIDFKRRAIALKKLSEIISLEHGTIITLDANFSDYPEKVNLANDDLFIINDSADNGALKRVRKENIGGTNDHALLQHLDFASAGHTGFQPKINYTSEYKAYEIPN